MAASKTIGGINVTISASTQKFVKGINIARRALTSMARGVKNFIFSMKGLAVAFATGAFLKFAHSTAEGIAALGDLSDKTGVATEKLAGYQLAAEEAGVSATVLAKALTVLSANGMTLSGWVKQTEKLTTHQERLNAAIAMFGIRGADMVRLVTAGSASLAEQQEAAENLGLSLDRATVAGVDRALEAWARFKKAVSGIFVSLVAEMAPLVEGLSLMASDYLATTGAGKGLGNSIATAIINMTKFVADGIQSMVGAVLTMVAEIREALYKIRNSNFGGMLGLTQTSAERTASASAIYDARVQRDKFAAQRPWSAAIDKAMEVAKKAAEAAAANAPANNRPGILGRAMQGIMSGPTVGNARDFGGQLLGHITSLPARMRAAHRAGMQFAFMGGGAAGGGGMGGGRPSLSFAQAGTADSYRQQAAMRRQADAIPRQQLAVQKEMRDGINQIANAPLMRPANFLA